MKTSRILILFTLIAILLAACSPSEPAPAAESLAPASAAFQVAEGRLQPAYSLTLAFSAGGRLAEVLVAEGDTVSAGQVLARLELANPELRQADLVRAQQELLNAQQALAALTDGAALRIAQAQYDLAALAQQIETVQADLDDENERAEPDELLVARLEAQLVLLNQQVAETTALLDKLGADGVDPELQAAAEARLASAEAALASAAAALQPVELLAPADGSLANLDLSVGQWITAGQPVGALADLNAWVIKTDNLTEIEVVGLAVGQSVSLVFDALPETELVGQISAIETLFEEKRGDITYTVTISPAELPGEARWGMTVAVRFEQ